ncbi:TrmH family RNA methyltransferase [Schaalia sp. lx-100]|uniref:TrmH family RNA methyltransferase n=1 Tax=Schaalia sp. lx-100 TaxID=2899081 RepID=UPI003FA7703A
MNENDGRVGESVSDVGPLPQDVPAGVGPWQGDFPEGDHWDHDLLQYGDHRNVEDRYRYWRMEAIREDIARRSVPFEVAIENLEHDFNIGSIVRTANALGVSRVHIVGRRRWNRRGAMVTDRYLRVDHMEDAQALADDCAARGVALVGIDNVPGSVPLRAADMPNPVCMVFGGESDGLSERMIELCSRVFYIPQRGSTRSMNVGHAAAIAMWAWVDAHTCAEE